MLAFTAYQRRRAWAAFHAGYGLQVKDAEIDDLLPEAVRSRPSGAELNGRNTKLWNAWLDSLARQKG